MLEYANPVWSPFTETNIQKLEKIQELVFRFITNKSGRHESSTELIRRLRIPSLENRAKEGRSKLTYQIVTDMAKTENN